MFLRKKLISKISFFSFLFLLMLGLGAASSILLTSCSDLFGKNTAVQENLNDAETQDPVLTPAADPEPEPEPVTITGQMFLNGALPQELLVQNTDRSAIPTYVSTEVSYFAVATSGSKTVTGTFGSGANASTFTLTLIPNQNWIITCGIKKAGSTNIEENYLLTATSSSFDPADIDTTEPLKFFPVPDTSSGTGQIDLSVSFASSVASVVLKCSSAAWPSSDDIVTVSGTTATIKAITGSTVESIPSGQYEVMMAFYDNNNALLYATVQNITVCKGLTARAWVSSGGDSPIESTGLFNVSDAKIQAFASTNFFVASAALGSTDDGFVAPADTNSGSHKAPFATLERALTQIANYGFSSKDYKIHISGEQKVAASATEGFVVSGLDSKMNSLTISGLNNKETDILDGDTRFCALKIISSKNITIQNLTIQHGTANDGGGIEKYGSGELTVNNCIVTGNTATSAGGGLGAFENSGDVTIKNSTFKSNTAGTNGGGIYSWAKLTIQNTEIKSNIATQAGGGIYTRSKDLTVSGSSTLITLNFAQTKSGGGIAVTDGKSLIFSDATVSRNTAQLLGGGIYCSGNFIFNSGSIEYNDTFGEGEDFDTGGGGVYSQAEIIMSGGIICDNTSASIGGGIFLNGSAAKLIMSGNAVIGDISREGAARTVSGYHSNMAAKGGGIFNRQGAVYIGYISETEKDDSFAGGVGYNYASVHGGGIYSIGSGSAKIYLNKAKIITNAAASSGGGIDIYTGTLEITDSEINNNNGRWGGALNIGRSDGAPTVLIQNSNIKNNSSSENGGAISFVGGNTTLADVQITNNHTDGTGGGIFFGTALTKILSLGTSTAESTITIKDNTEGASTPYSKSNVYLNSTDYLVIAGALSTDSVIGVKRATAPTLNAFTSGFKLKNSSIAPADIFTSDENVYEVSAQVVTGEAKLRITGAAGPALTWFYAVGNACMKLSASEIERLGLPEYHNSLTGTSFVLDKSSSGPFYNEETNDATIFTGNIYMDNPVSGTQVTAGTETSSGIPYSIAANAITDDKNMYIRLDFSTIYLNPETGNNDNGGFTKDLPIKTIGQAKSMLEYNTKANPVILLMGALSDTSEIEALNDLTRQDDGSVSVYNGAIVKRHSSFTTGALLVFTEPLTLQNVTLDGGAVWSKTQTEIEAEPGLLTTRTNGGFSSSIYLVNAGKTSTFKNVTIQNVDNTATGNTGNGAAIYINSGTVTLNNCLIKDCRAIRGAVFVTTSGKLNASNTSFLCNNSIGSASDKGHGGAVYLYGGTGSGGQATFDACSFQYNAANTYGGAVYVGNNASATFKNQGSNTLANNFSDMATAAASRTCKGDFVYTRGKLTLLGDFAFGTGSDALTFYIDNSSSSSENESSQHPISLGGSFGTTSTTGTAKIYLKKQLDASLGENVLKQATSDTSVNLANAKQYFTLANNSPAICEIDDDGKIAPLPAGGNIYTAVDYIFTLSADKTQVTRGEDSVITITPTVKRVEANGSKTTLYYNPSDQKLYENAAYTISAGANTTVSWSASLMCGPDVEYESLSAAATANKFTIPALSWMDDYTLNVTVSYMGVARDTSFAVECVAHAFNSTPYTVNSDGTVYFGDWPQSSKASGVTVNEEVSTQIGSLVYYLGSDMAWYAKYDTEYFKVEPVKWKVLTSDYNGTGYKLLFATTILEGRPYHSSSTKYDTSSIRAYLNDDFINTVFPLPAMQSIIPTVEIDNSARSTNPDTNPTKWEGGVNNYACDNTNDKVFLLSLQEVTTAAYGFSTDPTASDGNRNYSPTEYAKKTGAYSGGWWMTRSPDVGAGYLRYSNDSGIVSGGTRNWTANQCGMVPALCVIGD